MHSPVLAESVSLDDIRKYSFDDEPRIRQHRPRTNADTPFLALDTYEPTKLPLEFHVGRFDDS